MVKVGDTYSWTPDGFINERSGSIAGKELPRVVHGRIVFINRAHRFFLAAAELNGHTIRECFKF